MSDESGNTAENTVNPTDETPPAAAETTPAVSPLTPAEVAAVRELAIAAHPDAVPELIVGGTIDEIRASVAAAEAAYRRVAARFGSGGAAAVAVGTGAAADAGPNPPTPAVQQTPAPDRAAGAGASAGITPVSPRDLDPPRGSTRGESPPVVPGGGIAVDVTAALPPTGKIAAGLRARG